MPNAFCDHLGIAPPSLIGFAATGMPNYLDILVVALLERGGPMTLDEVVAAVARLSTTPPDRIRISLQKAWAGRAPVVKDADGRFTLDLESRHMRRILVRLGLQAPPPPPPGPPERGSPPPEELKACFWRGCPSNVSGVRLAAAVLDAMNRPMFPQEILGVVREWTDGWLPPPEPSPYQPTKSLVVRLDDGRLTLARTRTDDLHKMRQKVRELARPRLGRIAEAEWYRKRAEERQRDEAARLAAIPTPPASSKVSWSGTLISAQPRIRLTRSFDERSHSYLGYVLRVRGDVGGEAKEFLVGVGKAAHEKHQFRVGDEVSGEGVRAEDPDLETADLYRVSGLKVGARGPAERSPAPPFTGIPPTLEEYRARGHRRLAALTYAARCVGCLWGCEMAVEMIIDQWNPSKRRYRRETFCYGPKNCPLYAAGPCRRVPGRKGMSWTEEDWVDEDATGHRGEGE
jgi:hypothetical protein